MSSTISESAIARQLCGIMKLLSSSFKTPSPKSNKRFAKFASFGKVRIFCDKGNFLRRLKLFLSSLSIWNWLYRSLILCQVHSKVWISTFLKFHKPKIVKFQNRKYKNFNHSKIQYSKFFMYWDWKFVIFWNFWVNEKFSSQRIE